MRNLLFGTFLVLTLFLQDAALARAPGVDCSPKASRERMAEGRRLRKIYDVKKADLDRRIAEAEAQGRKARLDLLIERLALIQEDSKIHNMEINWDCFEQTFDPWQPLPPTPEEQEERDRREASRRFDEDQRRYQEERLRDFCRDNPGQDFCH